MLKGESCGTIEPGVMVMDSKQQIIDSAGYRENVGIIVINDSHNVIWCKRSGQDAWQFPQGGVQQDETIEQALFRELQEYRRDDRKQIKLLCFSNIWIILVLFKGNQESILSVICIIYREHPASNKFLILFLFLPF